MSKNNINIILFTNIINRMIIINKPKFDLREFVGGKLSNGIKYALIHDDKLEKSFVTISIKIGSYDNPKEVQGLAHFLEHMLFMGSSKYPDENHFNTRLNELGGYSNAYTDVMETVYYFEVFDQGLEEIFDIFSRFFIDPLFDPDSVKRELNAVNSEHMKNINSDMWRQFQLSLDLANTDSPVNTFITGSNNTLQLPDIRERVIDFYRKYYTTKNISICIASSKSPDECLHVIESTFGHIEQTQSHSRPIIVKPFYSENSGNTYHLKSISQQYSVTYMWEIPEQSPYLYSKDFNLLNTLLTANSEKSFYFFLKNKGLLKNISVDIKHEGVFIIKLNLTKEGLEKIDYIEAVLNKTLNRIMQMNFREVAFYTQKIMEKNFDCINKFSTSDLCNMLSVNHHYYDTSNIFAGSFILSQVKTQQEYLQLFTQHIIRKKPIKIICSQILPGTQLTYTKTREYGAEYSLIPQGTVQSQLVDFEYSFNLSNDFLNMEPHLVPGLDVHEVPILVAEKQWYGGISQFGEPNVYIWLQFSNVKYYSSPQNYVLTLLSSSLLNFLINVIMNKPVELCYGFTFEPRPTLNTINIIINATNDISKLHILLSQFNTFITNLDDNVRLIDRRNIENLIISFAENYKNVDFMNPSEYSSYIIKLLGYTTEYSSSELIQALSTITPQMVQTYISEIFIGSTLTSFVYGNINIKSITNIFTLFNKMFFTPVFPLPVVNQLTNYNIQHPNPKETSHCITCLYPVGKFIPKEYVLASLGSQILSQPFFDELRTKQQLGYIVSMSMAAIRDDYYIVQRIQSEKPCSELLSRINTFNSQMEKIVLDADFDKFAETLRNEFTEPEYSMSDKIGKYLPEISSRHYMFNRKQLLAEKISSINKEDLLDFIKRVINTDTQIIICVDGN